MGPFGGAHLQHSKDTPDRGLVRPALPQPHSIQTHDSSIPYLLILSSVHLYYFKTGSKFSTIVREYVTEPSRLSTPRGELRRERDFKCVKAEEKSNLKTSMTSMQEKKSTKLVKYQSSEVLCVIVVMLASRRIYNTHSCS
ncbi:hypothetical protein Tco_0008839 [Tanacetum coccineum]